MQSTFDVGDQVITYHWLPGIRRGACGQIVLVYAGANDFYDVHFDEHGLVRLVPGRILAPVVTPAARAKCNQASASS
jgi:hypothetical protein